MFQTTNQLCFWLHLAVEDALVQGLVRKLLRKGIHQLHLHLDLMFFHPILRSFIFIILYFGANKSSKKVQELNQVSPGFPEFSRGFQWTDQPANQGEARPAPHWATGLAAPGSTVAWAGRTGNKSHFALSFHMVFHSLEREMLLNFCRKVESKGNMWSTFMKAPIAYAVARMQLKRRKGLVDWSPSNSKKSTYLACSCLCKARSKASSTSERNAEWTSEQKKHR